GYVEVTDFPFGAGAPAIAPQAILKPGEFIGLFEFMDWITDHESRGIPDWTVTAGTASLRCAFNTRNDAFAKHLRRLFRPQEINEHIIKNSKSFLSQLMEVERIRDLFDQWTTDVLYFGPDWFRPLREVEPNRAVRSAGLELISVLSQRAWR